MMTIFEGVRADRRRRAELNRQAWDARQRLISGVPYLLRVDDFRTYEEFAVQLKAYRRAVAMGGRKFVEAQVHDGYVFGKRGCVHA